MRRPPMNLFRGERRRSLLDLAQKSRCVFFQFFRVQRRSGISTQTLAFSVIVVSEKSKSHLEAVSLPASAVKPRQPCGAAQRKNQDSGCQRIKSSEMSNAAETNQAAHSFHHVVRSFPARLVDDKNSVVGQRLKRSGHLFSLLLGSAAF